MVDAKSIFPQIRSLKGMFWQNNKKSIFFDECLEILDFLSCCLHIQGTPLKILGQ